jgi:hypothetical protein
MDLFGAICLRFEADDVANVGMGFLSRHVSSQCTGSSILISDILRFAKKSLEPKSISWCGAEQGKTCTRYYLLPCE